MKAMPTRTQRGAALLVVLLMLVAVLALGMTAAQTALQGEKAARNERDRQIAFQAAEAALLDAESDIDGGARSALFSPDAADGFVDGCGTGSARGLCLPAAGPTPVWRLVDFLDEQGASVPYGAFTGQAMPSGDGSLPTRAPRYVIELMPFNQPGQGADADSLGYFYRITALGFGTRESTQVVLQTFYRKHRE